jgi:manganese efflux pump family protein
LAPEGLVTTLCCADQFACRFTVKVGDWADDTRPVRWLPMLALLLVVVSLGLSNFAVSVGLGVARTDDQARLRVGVIFGIFGTGMPLAGLVLGHRLATTVGQATDSIAAGLLIITGLYALARSVSGAGSQDGKTQVGWSITRMLVIGLVLSVDSLAVGVALGTYGVNMAVAAIVIGAACVALSLLGLRVGRQMGASAGVAGEFIGGSVLVAAGIAIATGAI